MVFFALILTPHFSTASSRESLISKFEYYYSTSHHYTRISADSTLIYLDSAVTIVNELDDPFYRAKVLELKSGYHFFRSELDSAKYFSEASIAIYANYPDSLEYFIAVYNLGGIYVEMDDHIQGLVQFKKVIRIIDDNFENLMALHQTKVILNRAYAYSSIGLVYRRLGDYKSAIRNMEKAIKVTYRVDSRESEILRAVTLGNIGEAYFEAENYEEAENYAIAGLEQKNKLGLQASTGYNYQILAMAAYGRGKYDLCLRYVEEADEKFLESGNVKELSRDNFWRAKSFFKAGDFKRASVLLTDLEIAYKQGFSKTDQADLYDLIAEVKAAQGDYKGANEYLLISRMIREEVNVKNDIKMVGEFLNFFEEEEARLNDRIENLKNIQEKEKLELQIENDEEKKIWVYSLFLVSIICLVLIIFIIAKAYKRNKKINEELSHSIDEKQILFKEVHHRVKNNFQIISSLLNLQQGIEEDERGKKVLSDAQGRIQSMSLVHELLYRKNEVKEIGFKAYTEELVGTVLHSFAGEGRTIDYKIECDDETFDLEVAVPLGLIMNEAITNAVKYAFDGRTNGSVYISLKRLNDEFFEMIIQDDGIGIPDEFIDGNKGTLGMELINILTEQLGGQVTINNDSGTRISLRFTNKS